MVLPASSSPFSIPLAVVAGLVLLRVVLSWKSLVYGLARWWRWLDERAQAYQHFEIPRYTGCGRENLLHRAAAAYVAALPSLEDAAAAALVSSGRKSGGGFHLRLAAGHSAADSFLGSRLLWTCAGGEGGERLVLRVRRPDRVRVLRPYLQHVEAFAEDLELRRREIRLFITSPGEVGGGGGRWRWTSVPLTHPATLETVAMDPDLKNRVRGDLEAFLKGHAYYHRLGRVWRRSYLLYGPSGTGKSTFVAAMAKFLCYDIYDVDLSRFSGAGDDLKALLLSTSPRSVILVEDLDRYLKTAAGDGESKLSGILNFMDGVFSCCGEERVLVFTMTTACGDCGGLEGVEPAVLRPGRLDVHVHFPLCDFSAFKSLASSYLGLKDHKLYPQVEEVFQSGARMSPAEVGEIMIAHRGSPSRALKTVISALQQSGAGSGRTTAAKQSPSEGWPAKRSDAGDTPRSEVGGLAFGKDSTVREFKKLYGFIKMKTGSKKDGVMPLETAAAAAAAAGAPLDKDYYS